MNIFELLQIFDWVSPVVETGKDIHHIVTDGEPTTTIWLDKYELVMAKRRLCKAGIKVISDTWQTFDREVGIDVPLSQVSRARDTLNGIENW